MAQSVSWLVTILYVSIIWRRIGDVAAGQLKLATTTVGSIAGLLTLGMDIYLIKEVGRAREGAKALIGATLGLRLVMILPLILLSLFALSVQHPDSQLWKFGLLMI